MFEYSDNSALDYIMSFSHSGKPVKDLSRMKKLLAALGDPQDKLKFIHIAGTNGKGSMAEMFSGILKYAGVTAGVFTSPYIREYNDRIRVGRKNIEDDELREITEFVRGVVEKLPEKKDFSQFEITTAIALEHFLNRGCAVVVFETGLGGLLDCTNVVTTTVLSVIGSVDLDHTAVLGDTVEEIAYQKAGIIKPGVPCAVNGMNSPEVIKVIKDYAGKMGSPVTVTEPDKVKIMSEFIYGTKFTYKGGEFRTGMGGRYQVSNAMTVIEGARLIAGELGITEEDIRTGIMRAVLPCRTEVICKEPLTVLDGGHNPNAMKALANFIECNADIPGEMGMCTAIIGMCTDKDIAESVRHLIPKTGGHGASGVQRFVTVDGFSERAENKDKLALLINSLGGNAAPAKGSIEEEISRMQHQNSDGMTLICGSLFLAAEVKQLIYRYTADKMGDY